MFYDQKDYKKAIDNFDSSLRLKPDDPETRSLRAQAALALAGAKP